MKVGDMEFDDTLSYIYFSFFLILIPIALLVIVWMVVLFWKEMKENYVDFLRVKQYIFIWFCYCICRILWEYWYKHVNKIVFNLINEFGTCLEFLYYIINLYIIIKTNKLRWFAGPGGARSPDILWLLL